MLHVRAFDDSTSAIEESIKALRDPQGAASRQVSVSVARDLLTDQRLHLLRVIRKEQPESLAALARLVGRPDESVKADLLLLGPYRRRRSRESVIQEPDTSTPVSCMSAWRSDSTCEASCLFLARVVLEIDVGSPDMIVTLPRSR